MKQYLSLIIILFYISIIISSAKKKKERAQETNIGDATVACNPDSRKLTNGFATYFKDDEYACQDWNDEAKESDECLVAINGICGMDDDKFCDRCIQVSSGDSYSIKCKVIDFCDPKDCDYLDPGHIDFLNNNKNKAYKLVESDN